MLLVYWKFDMHGHYGTSKQLKSSAASGLLNVVYKCVTILTELYLVKYFIM